MNTLLEQLKEAVELNDETMIQHISKQLYYLKFNKAVDYREKPSKNLGAK